LRITLGRAGLVGATALVVGLWRKRVLLALIGAALVVRDVKSRSSR
jgi:hypothetical protein